MSDAHARADGPEQDETSRPGAAYRPASRPAGPLPEYDPQLPITARRTEILAALAAHPVLIVAGETGSGKSTQLPRYCLELGRGGERRIAHTQPRRLAARALASRIAQELREPVGQSVGYRVRFADRVSEHTRLVLMTDGLLLAELARDPRLERYDTVIIDEAHERSLNIDLLFGVLKRLLPARPDLKLIVTSATLEVERIARFFDDAPVIAVSGRSHPIEVRYAEAADDDPDLPTAVLEAYRVIATTPGPIGRGDVLVFLPGEREIRDVAELLERELQDAGVVLPLYSRLSWEEQSRIFEPAQRPRIVLATNVAETSITVPGIRAVIDSGLARISRYSPRSRLQRLPIEPVSRASAEQRKGRCGRIGPGLCLRLYSESDLEARPAFTEPEILRTNLAALLLRLAADHLGEAEHFPFIDSPDPRSLNDGYRLLQELEALDAERRITRRGRQMARLPLDPRLGRALIESRRFQAEGELLALVAALSIPDPRLAGEEAVAEDAAPQVAEDPRSEFMGLLRLWRAYRAQRAAGSRRELKRFCREARLSLLRMSEWEDVYTQVADRAAEIGLRDRRRPATYAAVHRSLLAGFCTMIGVRGEQGVYSGVRGLKFHLFPGSPLRRRRPRWVLAAHIVETSRVFARRLAEIEPHWVEGAAHHLVQREYLEPDFDEEREEVVARERVTLLGLTLAAHRRVNYGPIAPEESRHIFAREALVYGRLANRPDWLRANDAAIDAAERLEERLRTRDLVQPREVFVEHYATHLPRQVSSGAALEHFSRHLSEAQRAALTLGPAQILTRTPDPQALEAFPERAALGGLEAPITYRFAPGEADDGVTLEVPLLALPRLTRRQIDDAIPGLLAPRIEALLRSLPKEARRQIIPLAATVTRYRASEEGSGADPVRLRAWLEATFAIPPSRARFDLAQVPSHLWPRIALAQEGVQPEAVSEIGALRRRVAVAARAELDRLAAAAHEGSWRRFEASELPEAEALTLREGTIRVHPTLHGSRGGVRVRFEWSEAEAARSLADGGVHLARLMLGPQVRFLVQSLGREASLLLAAAPLVAGRELIESLVHQSVRAACFGEGVPPRQRAAFGQAVDRGRAVLQERASELVASAAEWFAQARAVRRALEDPRARAAPAVAAESQAHLARLLEPARLASLTPEALRQLPRHLRAEERRWQRLLARGSEAPQILRELDRWTLRQAELEREVASELRWLPELEDLRLWIEEYRVSLYAQELRTLGPVSAPRLEERVAAIVAWIER